MTPPIVLTASFVDGAGDRRPDVGARQPVLDGDAALAELGDLRLDHGQFALRLGAGLLVDGDDLQPDFADLGARAGDLGVDLGLLAGHAGHVAVARVDLRALDQALVGQALHLLVLDRDEPDLVDLGGALRLEPLDLLAELVDAELQLFLLRFAVLEIAFEAAASRRRARCSGGWLGDARHRRASSASSPSRSAISLARRTEASASCARTMASSARVCASSRRISISPSLTKSPSLTAISLMMPPSRCCTAFRFWSTLTVPVAMTAPAELRRRRPAAGAGDEQEAECEAGEDATAEAEMAGCRRRLVGHSALWVVGLLHGLSPPHSSRLARCRRPAAHGRR